MSISSKEARNIIRKALKRVPEGEEIRHLNIMPMMDIMTILLVTFVMFMAESAAFSLRDARLPNSQTPEPQLDKEIALMIAPSAILVEDKEIVPIRDGKIDAAHLEGGAQGRKIPKLIGVLAALRTAQQEKRQEQGVYVEGGLSELWVIADKNTPYDLLLKVLYSARSPQSGFKRFRLVVLRHEKAS